jgi:hypothetical protein
MSEIRQAHHHGGPIILVQRTDLPQHTVDAVADAQEALFRLEVDVRRATFYCVVEQCVDQAHDRLAVFVQVLRQTLKIDFAGFDFVQDAVDG